MLGFLPADWPLDTAGWVMCEAISGHRNMRASYDRPPPEITVRLVVMLARRRMRCRDLADIIGITEANLSLLKPGKVKGIRFATLARICAAHGCQSGDLLEAAPTT